jgi:TRAP-type mannitol/chloroaromatic compound transport system permease small subunit
MARKLKGKAREELKGEKLRKRQKEWSEAGDQILFYLPFILIIIFALIGWFTYNIVKQ